MDQPRNSVIQPGVRRAMRKATVVHPESPSLRGQGDQAAPAGAELVLDSHARIVSCTAAGAHLFAYSQEDIVGLPVARLLPILASFDLARNDGIDPTLVFLCHAGITFAADRADGTAFRCHLTLIRHGDSTTGALRLVIHNVDD